MKHLLFILFVTCLGIGLAPPVGRGDELAKPGNQIETFNLSTGGTGIYRPGKWGLIKIGLRNPQDRDVELLASTYLVGDPSLQYGRRIWMPAKSRLSTWHPILMPPLQDRNQKFFDLRSIVVNSSSSGEAMAMNEFGAMQFDQGLLVSSDEPVTAMILDQGPPPDEPLWITPQEFVLTARYDRGLRYNVTAFSDPLIPASEELLDSLDHLAIASDRILGDGAGIAAIRRWVAAGGKLWIMADRISPALLAALLGDEGAITEVDRVDLTHFKMEAGAWSAGPITFEREVEKPVKFVRVIAENVEVDFLIDGWPASFWKTHGQGRILVTTVGGDAWVRPRVPTDPQPPGGGDFKTNFTASLPFSQVTLDFFSPRNPPPILPKVAEEHVRQLVGYTIPGRGLVLGTLVGFTMLVLLVAAWFARQGKMERAGLAIPCLAIAAAAVLLTVGWQSRSRIPASTAVIQLVQSVPGTDTIRTSGLAGVMTRDARESNLAGTEGGWMIPDMSGLEGTTRRLVWSDIDQWHWENLPNKPGLRMIAFQTGGQVDRPVDAVVQFSERGVIGKLNLPDGLQASDVIIATPHGKVGLDVNSDGTFDSASVLGRDQFLQAGLLSDEQQRRSQVLSHALAESATQLHDPMMYAWTKPWSAGLSAVGGNDTVGSALVSIPLRWQRPAAGTTIQIPSPFLPFREVLGPDQLRPSGLYDYRQLRWSERSAPTAGWLAFTLPRGLTPLSVKSATITFKVLGPVQHLAVSAMSGSRLKTLKEWEGPVGTLMYEITDPEALKLDSQGRLLVRVDAGRAAPGTVETPSVKLKPGEKPKTQPGGAQPLSYWQFEEVSLQLAAEISAISPGNDSP